MSQSKKAPKKLPSMMVRVSQEAANRLEAETLRRSIRGGIVLSRSKVLDELILSQFPPADHPLIDDTENQGVISEVTEKTDTTGEKMS